MKPTDAELVKWSAERVLGLEVWTHKYYLCRSRQCKYGPADGLAIEVDGELWRFSRENFPDLHFNPLLSDAEAFAMVDAIIAEGAFWFKLQSPWDPMNQPDTNIWWAGFTAVGCTGWNGRPDHRASDPDRRRAIVLACLRLESGCLACCRTGEILPAGPSDAPVEICEACGGSGVAREELPTSRA